MKPVRVSLLLTSSSSGDWLKANPDNDLLLPDEVVEKTVDKYKEAFELLTGKPFQV